MAAQSWNDDSLKAGAVAARSYGAWYVQHPLVPARYDICDTTDCQFFSLSSTDHNTNDAVDYTVGIVLRDANSNIVRSEFASETNDHSCGQGYSGDPPTGYPCFADTVCTNAPHNGHGRRYVPVRFAQMGVRPPFRPYAGHYAGQCCYQPNKAELAVDSQPRLRPEGLYVPEHRSGQQP